MESRKNIFHNNFFLITLFAILLKIVLAGLFSSDYQEKIFIPFVDHFINNFGNPWQHYYIENREVAFPFFPLMLYFLSPFQFIINFLEIHNIFLKNLIFKIPTLSLDIIVYVYLLKLFPQKKISVFVKKKTSDGLQPSSLLMC